MAVEQKRMTYSEFEQFIAAPENRDRRFELINGEIVEVSPNKTHGRIAHFISGMLFVYLRQNPIGFVDLEARYKMPLDNHNAVMPDLAFTSIEREDPDLKTGVIPQMPDLAVEIKSPNDSYVGMRDKAAYYISNGARMVWLIYPEKRLIDVYRQGADLQILNEHEIFDGGDVLPGFTLPVREVFDV